MPSRLIMRLQYLVVYFLLLAAFACYAQSGDGKITGTVLDEQGRPIEGAEVCVFDYLPNAISSTCRTSTDKTGQFQVQHVPLGKHGVGASKREEGYTGLTNGAGENVNLTAESPLARVILKLGPKDGILAPTASDKITGKPICNFQVHWTIQEENSSQSATAGLSRWTKRISVPVGKDVCPSFSAKGYQTLAPTDPSDPSKPLCLRFGSGEVKSLAVQLVPVPNGAAGE